MKLRNTEYSAALAVHDPVHGLQKNNIQICKL